jgi:hypothetical protein
MSCQFFSFKREICPTSQFNLYRLQQLMKKIFMSLNMSDATLQRKGSTGIMNNNDYVALFAKDPIKRSMQEHTE